MWGLTVLEARSPRSRCRWAWFLQRAVCKKLFHAFLIASQALLAFFGIPWFVGASPGPLPSSSHAILPVRMSLCPNLPFNKGTRDAGLRLIFSVTSSNSLHLQQTQFQIRPHSEVPGVRISTHKFWGDEIQSVTSKNKIKSLQPGC